ncbi:MAG: shikimate dehydrogenase (NADP+) [bacterium]|nr:shikimate dehydrogenase (NADP+) [bacterium]
MPAPEARVLRLAPDAASWLRDGQPWSPPRPFYAVVGDPVGHSLSPRFQGAALRAAGLAFDYHAVEIEARRLDALRDRGRELGLLGLNVTAPHKTAAAALCARLTDDAVAVAAVNTVRWDAGGWEGHNTDVGGIAAVLAGLGAAPRTAVVIGAGGAARAAALACLRAGAARVWIAARSPRAAAGLRRWLATLSPEAAACIDVPPPGRPLSRLPLASGAVVVDATPPGSDLTTFLQPPPDLPLGVWLDLNYGPARVAAGNFGAVPDVALRLDGRGVLLEQGALAFAWWFGRAPDRAAMAAALEPSP